MTGCDGELDFALSPVASYTVNADYYWYEIGDMISIGNKKELYFCFPKDKKTIVAKTKMAAEELYKIKKNESRLAVK